MVKRQKWAVDLSPHTKGAPEVWKYWPPEECAVTQPRWCVNVRRGLLAGKELRIRVFEYMRPVTRLTKGTPHA